MEESIVDMVRFAFEIPETDIKTYSPLTLAYIGDAVFEIVIRTMLVEHGNSHVNRLNQKASKLVRASAQKDMLFVIEEMLTEEEHSIYKRGRNAKSITIAKNASVTDYRIATGLEALIGYLYLQNNMNRVIELIEAGLKKQ